MLFNNVESLVDNILADFHNLHSKLNTAYTKLTDLIEKKRDKIDQLNSEINAHADQRDRAFKAAEAVSKLLGH